jgi:hypothetical protein
MDTQIAPHGAWQMEFEYPNSQKNMGWVIILTEPYRYSLNDIITTGILKIQLVT